MRVGFHLRQTPKLSMKGRTTMCEQQKVYTVYELVSMIQKQLNDERKGNYILDSRKGRKIVHKSVKAKPPSALDAITDVVLAYRPKPKSKAGQKRKRKEKKLAK